MLSSKLRIGFKAVLLAAFIAGGIKMAGASGAKEMVTDSMVHEAMAFALKNISNAMCADQKPCAPASESERAKPPITVEDARRAMTIGFLSGAAEKCGLDWQQNFFNPLMRHFRHEALLNERQLALIAMLHGMQQAVVFRSASNDICTPDLKRQLSNSVAR